MFFSILNLFTFTDRLSLVMQLRMSFAITQLTTTTSYLLLLNSDNTLFIYSISSTPELLHQINQFQHHSVQFYSFDSSFFIIDAQTSQIYQIDTDHSFNLETVAQLKFSCHSLLSTVMIDRMKLFILADDCSTLAMWNVQLRTIKFIPILFDTNIQIREIFALETDLVLYDNKQRAHLWNIDNEQINLILDHHFYEININCLSLVKKTGNKWFFYNVNREKLLDRISLKLFCDIFCFTEDGKYLFGISQKESLLLMYRVDDGQLLEKLFIENILPHIQISKNYLILSSNNELLLLYIAEKDLSALKR